ncbi:MAG TPA: hypothetical protein VKI20_02660, partial [Acidimicrobiales bacterium]|nr:hypothetical protein [Acidimicrobiales bacterium]
MVYELARSGHGANPQSEAMLTTPVHETFTHFLSIGREGERLVSQGTTENPVEEDGSRGEWRSRRAASFLVRVLIVLVPMQFSLLAGVGLAHLLSRPHWLPLQLLWFAVVFASSASAYWATDRFARRLMPLAALLELSLLFPG